MKEEKIKRFISDEAMVEAVFSVIRDSFLEGLGSRDIQMLAAERISLDLLALGLKRLEKYKSKDSGESSQLRQIGL